MVGASGVGKTSLVRQYVRGLYDEKYLTTIGVKVDEKVVRVADTEVKLLLWDVAGAEERFSIPMSYIRGVSGCLLVIDGTCVDTVDLGMHLWEEILEEIGAVPFVVALNKVDLVEEWAMDDAITKMLKAQHVPIVRSSAKTGQGVEEAFHALTQCML
jgi:small GTP-binding protein